jgi:hypothetical protein
MRVVLSAGPFANFGAWAGVAAVLALCLYAAPALAQGSTGGSIGKQDKSISGDQDGGGSRSTSRERPSKSERSSSRSRSGGGSGNFDGTWNGASFGRTCSDKTTGVVAISGGRMAGDGFSGTVTGGGSVSGVWAGSGLTATVSGRISGSSGSGSFRRSDGCVGTWTLVKQ